MTNPDEPVSAGSIDKVGAVCSAVCSVHCASTAIAPGVLAALGVGALAGPAAEWGFTASAILFATWALAIGWKRHRNRYLAGLFVLGILGLGMGRWLEMRGAHGVHDVHDAGPVLSIAAGLTLVAAHVLSVVLSRRRRVAYG